jgi:hypothetical protein
MAVATAFGFTALMQIAASAQRPAASSAAAASQERSAPGQQVTVTGCVQRETDYRRAHDAGRGGVAGTGVGAGNEFVLVNASTTGSAAAAAYELTGANESKAGQYVGRRVEISGKVKAAEVGPSGKPTGGATAGKPPEGVDVGGKDLKLRELEITTIREATGTCPGA